MFVICSMNLLYFAEIILDKSRLKSSFSSDMQMKMDLTTPCSWLTTVTPGPTLTGPRGRRSWRRSKELSRLEREYLQVGQLTELYFPEKGVRFIAVNDSVDSLVESSNDFNPIRNWANELHAKDTRKRYAPSKKYRRSAGSGLVPNRPMATGKRTYNPKRLYRTRRLPLWYARSSSYALPGKGPTRSPES